MPWTLSRSRSVYFAAYVAAAILAVAVALLLQGLAPVTCAIVAGGAATLFLYGCGIVFKNSGFYDVYWSVFPIIAGGYWMTAFDAWDRPRALLAFAATTLWGVRLTTNWVLHFEGLAHEDWRYVDLRKKTGGAYPLASFGALHVFPFTLVTLGSLPLAVAIQSTSAIGVLDIVALVIGVGAVVLEAVSDIQLDRFRKTNEDPQAFMQTGLWAYSRHPNYCGEMLYWWSAALFGLAAAPAWWLVLGALGVTGMIVGASIPMAETRAVAKRPRFADYQRRVSALFPWFPKS